MSDDEMPEWATQVAADMIGKPYIFDKKMVVLAASPVVNDAKTISFEVEVAPIRRKDIRAFKMEAPSQIVDETIERTPAEARCWICKDTIPEGVLAVRHPIGAGGSTVWIELGHRSTSEWRR